MCDLPIPLDREQRFNLPYITDELEFALKKAKVRLDEIGYPMFKHLPPSDIKRH